MMSFRKLWRKLEIVLIQGKFQLVEQLALFSEVTEAVRWADIYQQSDDVIPSVVKEARDSADTG